MGAVVQKVTFIHASKGEEHFPYFSKIKESEKPLLSIEAMGEGIGRKRRKHCPKSGIVPFHEQSLVGGEAI